jgi:hypothetical protein
VCAVGVHACDPDDVPAGSVDEVDARGGGGRPQRVGDGVGPGGEVRGPGRAIFVFGLCGFSVVKKLVAAAWSPATPP